jgi:hypothetical protein
VELRRAWAPLCLLCGRRSTQSLVVELRFVWQAQCREPSGGAAARVGAAGAAAAFSVANAVHRASGGAVARVGAAGAAAAFRMAGEVHRASSTSCGPRGPRTARGSL